MTIFKTRVGHMSPAKRICRTFGFVRYLLGQLLRFLVPTITERKMDTSDPPSRLTNLSHTLPSCKQVINTWAELAEQALDLTLGSHKAKVHDFCVRVSNPRAMAYLDLKLSFDTSNLRSLAQISRPQFQKLEVYFSPKPSD